jgi:hypothetical protein
MGPPPLPPLLTQFFLLTFRQEPFSLLILNTSVGYPESDPHAFWPRGSGSIRQRYGSGFRILSFPHKCVEPTEIMAAK